MKLFAAPRGTRHLYVQLLRESRRTLQKFRGLCLHRSQSLHLQMHILAFSFVVLFQFGWGFFGFGVFIGWLFFFL